MGDTEPPKKKMRAEEDDNDDGKTCPICLEDWSNVGFHRVTSLKCGHLFGLSCINNWLLIQKQNSCPTCKEQASEEDLRQIYVKKLVAVDHTELQSIKEQLEIVTVERNELHNNLIQCVCRENIMIKQLKELNQQLKQLQTKNSQQQSLASSSASVKLFKARSLEICKSKGCRVLDCCSRFNMIVASMKSPNPLFNGYGIRKINLETFKPTAFLPLHNMPLRDVSFHPENAWLLCASLDKSWKVVDMLAESTVATVKGNSSIWSCCWDVDNNNVVYMGRQDGRVAKYDIRHLEVPFNVLDAYGDMSPVASLVSIPSSDASLPGGALISCKLNSVWLYGSGDLKQQLPLEGPFMSMKYLKEKGQLLTSMRANSNHPYARHVLSSVKLRDDNVLSCQVIHTLTGSCINTYLSKSCFVSNQSESFVSAHDESLKCVSLWSVDSGEKVASVYASEVVLDLCGFNCNDRSYLAKLTDCKLDLHKFH